MSWITENAWPLIIALGTIGVMAGLMFDQKGRMMAVGCFAAAALVWWIEGAVVTEAEVVEAGLQTMLEAFQRQDEAAVHRQISDDAPNLKSIASEGLSKVRLSDSFHMKDVRITLTDDQQTAVAHLRANGRATMKGSGYDQTVSTRWETTWKKQAGAWKLVGVKRLDVVSGEEMGILDPG